MMWNPNLTAVRPRIWHPLTFTVAVSHIRNLCLVVEGTKTWHLPTFVVIVANDVRSKPGHWGFWDLASANFWHDSGRWRRNPNLSVKGPDIWCSPAFAHDGGLVSGASGFFSLRRISRPFPSLANLWIYPCRAFTGPFVGLADLLPI